MPTPAEIISMVSSLQNDTAQTEYNNASCLPYLNIALDELQEVFEENNIPITNQVSVTINLPLDATTGITQTSIGFSTTPALPNNLIEIQQLWESDEGQDSWVPMVRKEFLPHYLETPPISFLRIWAWVNNEVKLLTCNAPKDIKFDFIQSLFNTPILIEMIDNELGVQFKNIKTHLGYATAALCSMYIGENETRAATLKGKADEALERALNIPTKGRQAIYTRRRPFRAGYKSRNVY